MPTLTKEQQKVWDKLNYVPKPFIADYDVNSMYADVVVGISKGVEPVMERGGLGVKVIKNRYKS